LVRLNRPLRQYHVNESLMKMDLQEILAGDNMVSEGEDYTAEGDESVESIDQLALILGLHIAREHPDGSLFIRFMLKHGKTA
jgi:hypothetical protein